MSDPTLAAPQPPDGGQWLGHPRGLFYCFFAEMWERFCFYGMRNVLVLYMVNYFMYTDEYAQGGPYAAYTSLVYCVALLGGFVADKYLGYRRSIMMGGILMSAGMLMLLVNEGLLGLGLSRSTEELFFYGGMATMIVGNGYFKPNISTIVGKLYPPGDPRRDGGFTIFYMGINIGAFFGGIICAELGQRVSWPLGFGVAALGMLLGVFTFGSKGATKALMGHGEPRDADLSRRSFPWTLAGSIALIPVFYFLLQDSRVVGWILAAAAVFMIGWMIVVAANEGKEQRERIFALLILVAFNPVFWAFFEQAGSSLTLYADRNLDRSVLGLFEISSGTVQQFNAFFIIAFAPVFAIGWIKLGRKGMEPSIPAKFVLGLGLLGLGFVVLVLGARYFSPEGMTPLHFMAGLYLMLTWGELCLSPVGLSMVTKLAPERMTGMVMGLWFLSIAGANFLAGQIAALTGTSTLGEGGEEGGAAPVEGGAADATGSLEAYADAYLTSAYVIFGATVLLLVLVPLLKKWMHGVK